MRLLLTKSPERKNNWKTTNNEWTQQINNDLHKGARRRKTNDATKHTSKHKAGETPKSSRNKTNAAGNPGKLATRYQQANQTITARMHAKETTKSQQAWVESVSVAGMAIVTQRLRAFIDQRSIWPIIFGGWHRPQYHSSHCYNQRGGALDAKSPLEIRDRSDP